MRVVVRGAASVRLHVSGTLAAAPSLPASLPPTPNPGLGGGVIQCTEMGGCCHMRSGGRGSLLPHKGRQRRSRRE